MCLEFPKSKGDPYYPINNYKNKKIFSKYKKLIKSYDIDVGIIDEVANFRNDKYPNDILTLKSLLSKLMKSVRDTAKFVDNL